MNSYINRTAIKKMQFRSAGVSVLSYIVHPLKDAGIYFGKIYKGEKLLDEFKIACLEGCNEKQVNINLSDFNFQQIAEKGQKTYELSSEGYLLLYDSASNNDYQIRLEMASKDRSPKVVFDTKVLDEGDFYAATLLRPGEYKGRNLKNNAEFEVTVVYPDNKQITKSSEVIPPANIEVKKDGFYPASVKINPGQGLVFTIKTPSTIELGLKKGYEKELTYDPELTRDKKSKNIRNRYRWVNPNKPMRKPD
ncbi:MAG: hypothetical protein ACKV1O_00765 [Saprospiraceae bacterium]